MKTKLFGVVAAIVLLCSPNVAGATPVFETTGWIVGTTGLNFEFDADTAPYTYSVTLADLSTDPFFGFDFLFLSITTATGTVNSITGPGSFSFTATPGETYFANVFGTGGGTAGAGLFGLEVVPEPGTTALLALGVACLALGRRRLSV
ncbi:MAG: PEP-CTERM sorting domain-containing protein [bacterium]|nr:PEP-CTERM sorting domain-containing protein [bacterium]